MPPLVSAANLKRAKSQQRPFPKDCLPKLRRQVLKTRSKWQLQQVLAILLRATYHLPAGQIAELIGWNTASVYRMQARYLREGDAVFDGPGRGGRHHQLLTQRAEKELIRALGRESGKKGRVAMTVVRKAYERAVGHPVPASTVYRMVARHGWVKAPVLQAPVLRAPVLRGPGSRPRSRS